MLALFYTVAHNTAVADPQIKSVFQPTQALVDPNATDRLIGAGNTNYVNALLTLAGAVTQVAQNPAAGNDPAAFAPVVQAASAADIATRQTAQTFSIDSQMHTENTVLALMQAPIQCAAKLPPSPGAPANGAGQKICGAVNALLGKYPFAPNSTAQASLDDVNRVFAPETGAVWSLYNGALKPYLVPSGAQYVPAPNPPQPVNAKFAQYFGRIAHISSDLYAPGAKEPAFGFTLRFLPSKGIQTATLVVDGQRIPSGASSQQFRWNGPEAHQASMVYDGNEVLLSQGTWALFQLVHEAHPTHSESGLRLNFPIETSVAGHKIEQPGAPSKVVSFEISGPGAGLLAPDAFSGLGCVSTVVKAQ
jgi:type VI secretion system protein ImpL